MSLKKELEDPHNPKSSIAFFLIVTVLVVVFGYAGIVNGSTIALIVSIFLLFILLLIIGQFIVTKIFLRELKKSKSLKKPSDSIPAAAQTEATSTFNPPAFKTLLYDAHSDLNLSNEAKNLYQTIAKRFIQEARIYRFILIIALFMSWLSLLIPQYTGHPNTEYYFYLSIASVLYLILLKPTKMKTSMVFAVPLLLSIAWCFFPFYSALGSIIANSSSETVSTSANGWTSLILGITISAILIIYHQIALNKLRKTYIGSTSYKLLYLWVFGTDAVFKLLTNTGFKWRRIGPTMLLNGKGMMSGDDFKTIIKLVKGKKVMIRNEQDLADVQKVFAHDDQDQVFEQQSVLCGDGIWKSALNNFMDQKEVVLMSLCGFSEKNKGCKFELAKLINEVPTEKFVLMTDQNTDEETLLQILGDEWSKMSPSSPNARASIAGIQIYKITAPEMPMSSEKQPDTLKTIKILKAQGKEGDRIVQLLCEAAVKTVSS